MTVLSASDLVLLQQAEHRSSMYLSIYNPETVMQCRVNDASISKGARIITYNNVTQGNFTAVLANMVILIGTSAGMDDVGRSRVRSATSTQFTIAENSDINWSNQLFLTVLNYVDVIAIYPRIIPNPNKATDVIFYKDYDIAYTNQNSILGSFVCMGPNRAGWKGDSLYWSSSGTVNVNGNPLNFSWEFEGGTPTGSTLRDPGYIQYNTPGQYRTRLTVTDTITNAQDIGWRFTSIYDRPENGTNNPISQFEITELSGNRSQGGRNSGQGGYTAKFRVYSPTTTPIEGATVILFTDDYYGVTHKSIGGNSENNSTIFFVGYILKGSITYNYQFNYVEFSVGSITEFMKQIVGFSVSCQADKNPDTWFKILNMTNQKAIYHYLRWHSTVGQLADFQYTGDDRNVQYFDTTRDNLYDSIEKFVDTGLMGSLTCDRQGKIWEELTPGAVNNARTAFPVTLQVQKNDWMGNVTVDESPYRTFSYLEMGGVAYSGPITGSFSAYMACAPGNAPSYRGRIDTMEGLILLSQAQLNTLVGNVFAYDNPNYPRVQMEFRGNYNNYDIAPIEDSQLNLLAADNPQGIVLTNEPFHPVDIKWTFDDENQFKHPTVTFFQLNNGVAGDTINIPITPTPLQPNFPPFPVFPPFPPILPPPSLGGNVANVLLLVDTYGLFYTNNFNTTDPAGPIWLPMNNGLNGVWITGSWIGNIEISNSGKCYCLSTYANDPTPQLPEVYLAGVYFAPNLGAPWTKVYDVVDARTTFGVNTGTLGPPIARVMAFGINRQADDELLILAGATSIPSNTAGTLYGNSNGVVKNYDITGARPTSAADAFVVFGANRWQTDVGYLGTNWELTFNRQATSLLASYNTSGTSGNRGILNNSLDGNTAYVIEGQGGTGTAIFKSADAGITWSRTPKVEIPYNVSRVNNQPEYQSFGTDPSGLILMIGTNPDINRPENPTLKVSIDSSQTYHLQGIPTGTLVSAVWNLGTSNDWVFAVANKALLPPASPKNVLFYTPDMGQTVIDRTGNLKNYCGGTSGTFNVLMIRGY